MPRRLVVMLVVAMTVVFLPVEPLTAEPRLPEVVSETLEGLPATSGAMAATEDAPAVSEQVQAPIPFSALGLRGPGEEPGEVRLRTQDTDGEWSPWVAAPLLDQNDGPDPETEEGQRVADGPDGWATDLVWAGEATGMQIEVDGVALDDVEVTVVDSMGLSEGFVARTGRQLRSLVPSGEAREAEAATRPGIVTRQQWGANESWRRGSPSYARVRHAVLHHTAGSNGYTRSEAVGQVRGIYRYHTQTLGWNDIGYNFLVDRFGTVYEGRHGGMEAGVIGAHARGYNTGSFGVALMGNHDAAPASSAAMGAAADVMAWKYRIHSIDPDPGAFVTAANGHRLRTMVGHRDVGNTACPGRYVAWRMDDIRRGIASRVGSADAPLAAANGWWPLTGDWNGDGRETAGWYRNGRWRLSNSTNNHAKVDYRFSFGRAGDLPVVGDFNGDGADTVGIFRDGRWHLRYRNAKGPADESYSYGRAGDVPVVGDFNGSRRDSVGVVRGRMWHLRYAPGSGPAQASISYGRPGDVPVVGNWNGRMIPGFEGEGIGVRRGNRWILRSRPESAGGELAFRYGRAEDLPVVADWNGPRLPTLLNGLQTGIGIARGTDWHVRRDPGANTAHASFTFGP